MEIIELSFLLETLALMLSKMENWAKQLSSLKLRPVELQELIKLFILDAWIETFRSFASARILPHQSALQVQDTIVDWTEVDSILRGTPNLN